MATRLTESAVRELLALETQATPGEWPQITRWGTFGEWCCIGPLHGATTESEDKPGGPAELAAQADAALLCCVRNLARPLAESWLEMREQLETVEASGWTMDLHGALLVAQDRIRELESGAVLAEKLALQKQVQELENRIKELLNTNRDEGDHEPRDTGDSPGE